MSISHGLFYIKTKVYIKEFHYLCGKIKYAQYYDERHSNNEQGSR